MIRMIESRRPRWARSVARMGKKRNAYRILVGKPEMHHTEIGSGLIWLRIETSGGLL
jgi:hypothetical protein